MSPAFAESVVDIIVCKQSSVEVWSVDSKVKVKICENICVCVWPVVVDVAVVI